MADQGHHRHVRGQDIRPQRTSRFQKCGDAGAEERNLVLGHGGEELQRGQTHQYKEREGQ